MPRDLDEAPDVATASARQPGRPGALPTVALNERWRVTSDDAQQWILAVRKSGKAANGPRYQPRQFYRSRTGLCAAIGRHCGDVRSEALAIIEAWPDMHPDLRRGGDAGAESA